jgi:effector-binding domain-containing protein
MNYEVHVKQVAPATIVTERKRTTLAKLGGEMDSTLASIAGAVKPAGSAEGAPFAIYYNEPFRPDDIDVEMGLPVARDAEVDGERVQRRVLEGGPVAYTLHVGPYGSIGAAYEALRDWIARHGHTPVGPPRELYIVGPGQGARPSEYQTEIEIPIA